MNWLRNKMYGRYGSDQLGIALLVIAIIISVVSYFVPVPFLGYLSLAPLVFGIYRIFSKNITKRQQENYKFLKGWYGFKNFFVNFKDNIRARGEFRFFKCPGCGQKVRVPKGKGKINITCPKCKNKFMRKS